MAKSKHRDPLEIRQEEPANPLDTPVAEPAGEEELVPPVVDVHVAASPEVIDEVLTAAPLPEPMPEREAVLGDTVLFRISETQDAPALVTQVYSNRVVALVTFGRPAHSAYGGPPQAGVFRDRVVKGEEVGQWKHRP